MLLNDRLENNFVDIRITIPLTHHMTFPASATVFVFSGLGLSEATPANVAVAIPMWQALAVGTAFGIVGELLGENGQRLTYAYADNAGTRLRQQSCFRRGSSGYSLLLASSRVVVSSRYPKND